MAAGFRSPFAFWVGGGGVSSTAPAGGARSMLAPWVGGAGVPSEAAPGVRSLLAFWVGGAGATQEVEPPAPPPSPGVIGGRLYLPPDLRRLQRQRLIEDEELLAAVLIAAMPGLMRRH